MTKADKLAAISSAITGLSAALVNLVPDDPVPVPTPIPTPVPVPPPPTPTATNIKLGSVPYYGPGSKWNTLLAKGSLVGATIINPNSGPGTAASSGYAAQVTAAKAAGAPVLGYVYTSYGARPVADVIADIDRHVAFYGVTGVFFDEVSTSVSAPYTTICAYARGKGLKVAVNPGTAAAEGFMAIADYAMTFESSMADYQAHRPPAWELNAAYAGRVWHVVYGCDASTMPAMVALAKTKKCGLLWVTDDVLPNPYDTNPSYLDALCAELVK